MAEKDDNSAKQEKLKALQLTMDKIDKTFGKGAIMRMGESVVESVSRHLIGFHGTRFGIGRWRLSQRQGNRDLWS